MGLSSTDWMNDQQKQSYEQYKASQDAYNAFVIELSNPNSERNRNFKGRNQGLFKEMSQEELLKLKKLSEDMLESGQRMKKLLDATGQAKKLEGKKERTTEEEAVLKGERELELDMRRTGRTANRELSYIENVDMNNIPSYTTLHRQCTDVVIDAGDGNLEKVGGFLSDRVPLRFMNEKGELEEGFFTQDFSPEWTVKEVLDRAIFVAPSIKDIIESVASTDGAIAVFAENDDFVKKNAEGLFNTEQIKGLLEKTNVPKALYKDRSFTQEEASAIADMTRRLNHGGLMKEVHKKAGIDPGRNINQRNTAMSDIATLLGCSKDIAKSVPMTLMVNGKPVRGSFMKKANGMCVEDIGKDFELTDSREFEVDYKALGESCANVMILDYICANIDRHAGNIFANIAPGKDGKMILSGVVGIDNDLSFGKMKIKEGQSLKFLPALDEIKSIPRSLANQVQKMDKASLSAILLNDQLNQEEIDSCWDRVQKLQKKIEKNPNGFIVDEYTKEKFEELSNQKFKHIDSDTTMGPQSPFKHASRAIASFKEKFAEFADKVKSKLSSLKNSLGELFNKKLNNAVNKELEDPEYEKWIKEIKELKAKKLPVPQELKEKAEARHKQRIEKRAQINKAVEEELGFNANDAKSLESKARKTAEKEIRDEAVLRANTKRNKQGIKKLHQSVHMESTSSVKGQAAELANIIKRFNKIGSDGTPEFENLMVKIQTLNNAFKKVEDARANDMTANLLHDCYSDVKKAISEYIPAASGKKGAELSNVAEYMDNLCDIAEDSRERQVNELNEMMANAFKEMAAYANKVQKIKANPKLGENSFEYKLADAEFKAKETLAGVVGNLGPTNETQVDFNKRAIAKLTVIEHINNLKTSAPNKYSSYENMIQADPKALDNLAESLTKSKTFKELTANVNVFTAIMVKPEKHFAKTMENTSKMTVFDDIAAGKRNLNGEKLQSSEPEAQNEQLIF